MIKKQLFSIAAWIPILSLAIGSADFLSNGPHHATAVQPAEKEKPVKRSGKPVEITYDDLNTEMKEDMKWDAKFLTDRIKELEGKTVKIAGFMLADFRTKGITEFVMLKNTECKFGPGGAPHHVVLVHLGPGEETRYTTRAVAVEGVLQLKPWEGPDGNTWALYELRDGVVR
jgi:hypothetical protein